MIRVAIEEIALFLVPFVLFALWLVLRRRQIAHGQTWKGPSVWLAVAGLSLVIGGFVFGGLFGERNTGKYVPPHMEDGKPVPGHFE